MLAFSHTIFTIALFFLRTWMCEKMVLFVSGNAQYLYLYV